MLTLGASFFAIALVYSMVGFGGGSSYIALLAASGMSHDVIPQISLLCNILVVSGSCFEFYRKGHFQQSFLWPLLASSVPMAFLGGLYRITEKSYFILLTGSLFLSGLRLLFLHDRNRGDLKQPSTFCMIGLGSTLGLLSGMVGIGGGIFLSPLLINLKWMRSKEAAATASLFIFLNSIAGLLGQLLKTPRFQGLDHSIMLFLAVILGGQIGIRLGTHQKVSYSVIQKTTGLLILFISARLLYENFQIFFKKPF